MNKMASWLYGHEDEERQRGILSPADREFLLTSGENMSSEQARRNARRRIRERIRHGIIDFDLITRLLLEEDRDQLFEEEDEWQPAFQAGQKSMIEFLYNGLRDSDGPLDFETLLRSGVHDAELGQHGGPALINVEFDVETNVQFDLEDARERFERGESLTIAEIGALLTTGEVDDGEELQRLAELSREKGVVRSSISPMANLSSNRSSSDRDAVSLPTEAADAEIIQDLLMRGEAMTMMNAYHEDFGGFMDDVEEDKD